MKASPRNVALLRGINVGGKNMVPMRALASIFVEAGCGDVQTFIQSGNVIFSAEKRVLKGLSDCIAKSIEEQFGCRVPVLLRTAVQMKSVVRGNPFLQTGAAEDSLHVYFLAGVAGAEGIAKLDPERSPPDRFAVMGGEIYLQLANGVAKTKLTNAYFDMKLGTTSTLRNWRTVLKLYELMVR